MTTRRDLSDLSQVCPRCRNRGWIKVRRGAEPCNCEAGAFVAYRAAVIDALSPEIGVKNAELWLETPQPSLGGERPVHLLRDERRARVAALVGTLVAGRESVIL